MGNAKHLQVHHLVAVEMPMPKPAKPRWFLAVLAFVMPTIATQARPTERADDRSTRAVASGDAVFRHFL